MSHAAQTPSSGNPRAAKRSKQSYECSIANLEFTVQHPGGSASTRPVRATAMSTQELTVMHRGFVYVGSECRVVLPTREGDERMSLTGSVAECVHVEGELHEVVMQFVDPIDPRHFLQLPDTAEFQEHGFDPLDLTGEVMLVDDQEAVCRLAPHQLRETRVDLAVARGVDAALETLRSRKPDVVLLSLDMDDGPMKRVLDRLRAGGYQGPVIGTTVTDPTGGRDAILEAGYCGVLIKPFTKEALFTSIAKWIGSCPSQSDEPIYSTFRDDPSMRDLIGWYLQQVTAATDAIRKAIKWADVPEAQRMCRMIYETALGYGYREVSELAGESLRQLNTTNSIPAALPMLRQLESTCARLR